MPERPRLSLSAQGSILSICLQAVICYAFLGFYVDQFDLGSQVRPLIWVEAQVERHSRSRVEFMIKARSQFKERRYVKGSIISVPVPGISPVYE